MKTIYKSEDHENSCYNCIRLLWCGCCDPEYHITTKFVKSTTCNGCGRTENSMAIEDITDIQRKQCCLWVCASCCCPSIFPDIATIVLYGADASLGQGGGAPAVPIELSRVKMSTKVFDELSTSISFTHSGWRAKVRKVGQNL